MVDVSVTGTGSRPTEKGDRSAEIDTLRKLQEKARVPDMKRVIV